MEINLISIKAEFEKLRKKQTDVVIDRLVVKLAEATPVDTGKAAAGWRREGNKIINEVDYIDNLNAGTSRQAPSFFVEKTVLSHNGVKPSGTIVRSL